MPCEVSVTLKDKDRTMTQKTRVYDKKVTADFADEKIDDLVDKAAKQFGGDPVTRKCKVTITLIDK